MEGEICYNIESRLSLRRQLDVERKLLIMNEILVHIMTTVINWLSGRYLVIGSINAIKIA